MGTHTTYPRVKTQFQKLFKVCDKHVAEHPEATLEYDEMNEEDPTLGFEYKDGIVEVHTVFVLRRTKGGTRCRS